MLQIGLVSYGKAEKCGMKSHPVVFTLLTAYEKWIQYVIKTEESRLEFDDKSELQYITKDNEIKKWYSDEKTTSEYITTKDTIGEDVQNFYDSYDKREASSDSSSGDSIMKKWLPNLLTVLFFNICLWP